MPSEVIGIIVVVGLLLLYAMLYVRSGQYLVGEPFQGTVPLAKPSVGPISLTPPSAGRSKGESPVPVVTELAPPVETPYLDDEINNVDDYEFAFVYKNESEKALSKEMRDKLMSQYPMDWSGYPPSSAQFQAGLRESFENATPSIPDSPKPYSNVSGETMMPPDNQKVEREERKILQTYMPKFPPNPTAYDPKDVDDLLKKMYDKKGLIPIVKHREGTNIYEIVGTQKKGEKVRYEDEPAPASAGAVPAAGEMTTPLPRVAQDQFFEPSTKPQGAGRWDYTAWTPGLERMFAPNERRENWY